MFVCEWNVSDSGLYRIVHTEEDKPCSYADVVYAYAGCMQERKLGELYRSLTQVRRALEPQGIEGYRVG